MRRWPTVLLRHVLLALLALIFSAPVVLLLMASLHPPGSVPVPGALWPPDPGLAAYRAVFESVPMARALVNSAAVTGVAVPIALVTASLAGFGIGMLGGRARRLAILALVVAASVPYAAIWLPRFLMVQALGLSGSWFALWLPALMGGSPLLVLLYLVAIARLPRGPLEAARLEGLSWLRIWWQVVLPQLPAVNLAAAFLAAAWSWANFLDPLLYIHAERWQTAPLMLHALQLLGTGNWSVLMAAAVILVLPLLGLGLLGAGWWQWRSAARGVR